VAEIISQLYQSSTKGILWNAWCKEKTYKKNIINTFMQFGVPQGIKTITKHWHTILMACEYGRGFAKFSSTVSWLLVPNEDLLFLEKRKTHRWKLNQSQTFRIHFKADKLSSIYSSSDNKDLTPGRLQ
jgi:hypothetical protein